MSKIKKISLRLSTPRDVKKTLSRISNLVANGEMDTKQANYYYFSL